MSSVAGEKLSYSEKARRQRSEHQIKFITALYSCQSIILSYNARKLARNSSQEVKKPLLQYSRLKPLTIDHGWANFSDKSSTLYVAWLWTTVIWPSKSVCVWKLHSKILWLVRTRPINTVQGNYYPPECLDCSGGNCSLLKRGGNSKVKSNFIKIKVINMVNYIFVTCAFDFWTCWIQIFPIYSGRTLFLQGVLSTLLSKFTKVSMKRHVIGQN